MTKKVKIIIFFITISAVINSYTIAAPISKDKLQMMTGICTGVFGLYEIADKKDKPVILKVVKKYANNFKMTTKQFTTTCTGFINSSK